MYTNWHYRTLFSLAKTSIDEFEMKSRCYKLNYPTKIVHCSYDDKDIIKKVRKRYNILISLNIHKPQVCYKYVFNKVLLNSIRKIEQR